MTKLKPTADTKCIICGKPIFTKKYGFSKTKQRKILFFHEICYEKITKKG
jgi:hypothetical protein